MRFILVILLTTSLHAFAQNTKQLYVGFYNQENLFDTIDNPLKIDEEWLPASTREWGTNRYHNKINHMALVIAAMNDSKGPDLLGMCEVENDIVLRDLLAELDKKNLHYGYLWFEGPDERGIDNAIIYKKSMFSAATAKPIHIDPSGIGGDHTRDILLGQFVLQSNKKTLFLFANHFPSRREGQTESEYKRLFVASILKSQCDSLQKLYKNPMIIIEGDFNDMPNNKSLYETFGAKEEGVANPAVNFCNLSYNLWKSGEGSYLYKGSWDMLDQIIISPSLQNEKSSISYKKRSVQVFKQDWMIEQEGKYKGSPLRTFGGQKYLNGYSDHFPVFAVFNVQ